MSAKASVIQVPSIEKASGLLVGLLPNKAIEHIGGYPGIVQFVKDVVEISLSTPRIGDDAIEYNAGILASRMSAQLLASIGGKEGIRVYVRSVLSSVAYDPEAGQSSEANSWIEKIQKRKGSNVGEAIDDHRLVEFIKSQAGEIAMLKQEAGSLTYASKQSTTCPCGNVKHTPLRRDEMGGYVCLTCIDKQMNVLQERLQAADALIASYQANEPGDDVEKALEPIIDFAADIPEHILDEDRAPVGKITAGHFRALIRMWPRISSVLGKARENPSN